MQKKQIILGICGSIAAVKGYEVSRRLSRHGYDVQVVLTSAAKSFVTELPFQVFTGNPACSSLFEESDVAIRHVELANGAELLLVMAATAETMAKLNHGIADNLLTALALARPPSLPTVIVPAMNEKMWRNDATRRNVAELQKRGIQFWGPTSGSLACGVTGEGRMIEPDEILTGVDALLCASEKKRGKIVITAGATREYLDPVRFLSNPASGKSGYELALSAYRHGFDVVLIGANLHSFHVSLPPAVVYEKVSSVEEMKQAMFQHLPDATALIMNAAVGDYTPAEPSENKLKKSDQTDTIQITFRKTEDLSASARRRFPSLIIAGYAAETENIKENAYRKLQDKGLNLICANAVRSHHETPFGSDENALLIFNRRGLKEDTGLLSKRELAERVILSLLEEIQE